jgi:hypothetical protein
MKMQTKYALVSIAALVIISAYYMLLPVPAPSDCWFYWTTNYSSVTSKVHVWNLTETGSFGSCDLLKSLCFDIQINHYNYALDYNCVWKQQSSKYENRSCICSHTDTGDVNASH